MKAIPCQDMTGCVPREGHKNVSVPVELFDRVEKVVEEGEGGYTSVAEFVRAAVRDRLRDYEPRLDDESDSE